MTRASKILPNIFPAKINQVK